MRAWGVLLVDSEWRRCARLLSCTNALNFIVECATPVGAGTGQKALSNEINIYV